MKHPHIPQKLLPNYFPNRCSLGHIQTHEVHSGIGITGIPTEKIRTGCGLDILSQDHTARRISHDDAHFLLSTT